MKVLDIFNDDCLDFDFEDKKEDTNEKELKVMLSDALEKIDSLNDVVNDLKEVIAKQKEVNKNVGRKACVMFYENKEISNAELRELRKEKSIAEILNDFTYIDENDELICARFSKEHKIKCRSMVRNRLRLGR